MTGPEHYREAERLLAATVNESVSEDGADHYEAADDEGGYDYSYLLAAQVHATLALAAATAAAYVHPMADGQTAHEWRPVITPPKEAGK